MSETLNTGAAAHRALLLHMDERDAGKDPTRFQETVDRVTERLSKRFHSGMTSFGAVVRAVAEQGDPEAKQFLADEPEQLGD
jgi:hypothetical protein